MIRWYSLLFLLSSCCCTAQPVFDVLQLTALKSPSGNGKSTSVSEIQSFFVQMNVPVMWNRHHTTIINPVYEERNFEMPFGAFDRRFLSAALQINHRMILRDTTQQLLFAGAFRHYGEAGLSPSGRTLTPAVAVLYGRQWTDRFQLKIGAYYSREFFGDFWLPLVGYDWQASRRLWCWGILPRYAVADYAITRRVHACIFYKGTTDSYRIRRADYFVFIEGQIRMGLEYYIPRTKFVLTADAGHSAARQFLTYDALRETETERDPSDGWIFRAGIQFRIITNKHFQGPDTR